MTKAYFGFGCFNVKLLKSNCFIKFFLSGVQAILQLNPSTKQSIMFKLLIYCKRREKLQFYSTCQQWHVQPHTLTYNVYNTWNSRFWLSFVYPLHLDVPRQQVVSPIHSLYLIVPRYRCTPITQLLRMSQQTSL